MSRIQFLLAALGAASLACSSSTTDISPPILKRPANGISIVLGAQSKGAAAFTPNPLVVSLASATGGVVKWFNDDQTTGNYGTSGGTTHNITADDRSFASGNISPGGTFARTFAAEGSYPYHCSIHPTMKGTVAVGP